MAQKPFLKRRFSLLQHKQRLIKYQSSVQKNEDMGHEKGVTHR
jgi:hypothetical protein